MRVNEAQVPPWWRFALALTLATVLVFLFAWWSVSTTNARLEERRQECYAQATTNSDVTACDDAFDEAYYWE